VILAPARAQGYFPMNDKIDTTKTTPIGGSSESAEAAHGGNSGEASSSVTTQAEGDSGSVASTSASRGAEARLLEGQLDEAKQKLKEAETRATENLDRWQRAQADLANYRRRAQFDREEQEKFAVATLVSALLPVLDSFDRAWQSLPGQLRRLTWLSGVAMIHSQLRGTLERVGLTEIDAEGKAFDPTVHEAVDRDEHEGPPHVVAVLQAGYRMHERVLRPALVKVGAKPASSPSSEPEPGQYDEAPSFASAGTDTGVAPGAAAAATAEAK